mgnify:CR=1 FL=1
MRDEIQKRPVLLPHRHNRHRISLHCIRETEAVPSNSKEETVSIYEKRSRTPYDQTDVFRPSCVLRSFFGGMQETRPTLDSLERFSVPIGEINVITITAGEYLFQK